MVRETRHLWVGNLPENIREDRIREHFKRYGRVQSVKLLPRGEECPVDGGSGGSTGEGTEGGSGAGSGSGGGGGSTSTGSASATVAFMDIKSAAKAHATEHTLDERALTTQYYEPQHLQHRFPAHGSSEDHGPSGGGVSGVGVGAGGTGVGVGVVERGVNEAFEPRVSHGSFYSGERVNRVVEHSTDPSAVDPGGYIPRGRPTPVSGYHVTSTRARDRLYPRTGPYATGPPPPPHLDRHRGSIPPSSWSSYESASSRYASVPPPPSPATTDAYQEESGVGVGGNSGVGSGSAVGGTLRQHKKQRRKSRSGSSSPSGSSRSGSSSSRTSRSGSTGGSSSGNSSSPGSSPHRSANAAVSEDRRPLAICVRNLPARSSDTSLKDGLFHEYKKHGKVTWVKVVGAAGDRYALVCFKKPEDVEKALEVSHDKLFFGCKIEVVPYQGYDVEDNEFRPYEAELDEYHPKATRTLFIGNLEKDVTASELRKHFEPFGEVIEIDIKKQGAVSSYAFCQYADIGSVVKAMRSMDGEHLGSNRIKLGFGKSMPTACVWVDGIGDCVSEKYINMQFHQFGPITQVVVDRERGHALVFFEQIACAQTAVKEMRGAALRGRRLQVDFASRECQETFYEHLERQGFAGEKPWDNTRPSPAATFDVARERSFESAVTVPNAGSRFTRYETPPRARTASYSRTPGGGSTPGASPAHPTAMSRSSRRSYQTDTYYEGDYTEPAPRRYGGTSATCDTKSSTCLDTATASPLVDPFRHLYSSRFRRFRSYDEFSQGSGASHDDYETSVIGDGKINDDDLPPPPRRHAVQSVVTSVEPPAPPPLLLPPPDIRHLQKERVHLLEQLEECHSSGDEGFAPKKRAKLDAASSILCEDDEPEIASLLVTSHSGRKGMDVRRVSDSKIIVHHGARRGSLEGRGPGPCKRRRDTTSRHHEHHDGSRPGTPLVDERPENIVPSEPRRFRERSHEGPLSLPLPRFAAQMMNNNNTSNSNNNNGGCARPSSTTIAKVASPPCSTSLPSVPSPRAAPQPPASPPPRHPSPSPTSSDSETAPQSPSLEERIRSLDEKYEKWSGSRALSAAGGDALAKLDATTSERFRFRHKLLDLDLNEVQPSDIVKSVLAKRSVFDEDSKRLENFNEKYEPREFTGVTGVVGSISIPPSGNLIASTGSCSGKVGLQYPFPSHPPIQSSSSSSSSSSGSSCGTPSTPTSSLAVSVTTPSVLTTATTTCTTLVTPSSKNDPRTVPHNCVHPTTATPITPGTSIKTVSPELPPATLPIGLGNVSAASSNAFVTGQGIPVSLSINASTSLSLSASTSRTTSLTPVTLVNSSPSTIATSTISSSSSALIATLAMVTTGSPTITTIASTSSYNQTSTTLTQSASSSSSSSISSISSNTETSRGRLKKDNGSRESRDSKDSRDSRHSRGSKDCSKSRSRKDEIVEGEKNRRDREERDDRTVVPSDTTVESETHKETKEAKHERKEREDRERREKEERERQERRDKEERDRQERKEREERERREKDEERRERERLDKERQEKERRDREERERERKEREEFEARERREKERKEREEKDRAERREREERERKERERLEREKQEKERIRKEREETERREKEERERIERERRREEKEKIERDRKREREERERLERERRKEKEKEERDRLEKEKREKEEKERLERDKHEKEKRREREDQERREKEKAAEREKRREREEKDKDKKDREESRRQQQQQQQPPIENHIHLPSTPQPQPQASPAPVTIKRRCSSQDAPLEDEAKRMKISEHRRDSKDRPRQNRRSEDRKHRNDSHRTSRDSRESRESKESSGSMQQIQDNRDSRETIPQPHCEINREIKDCRENREVKDCRDNREVKDCRENRENKDCRSENREVKDCRENRDSKESRENRENPRDIRDIRDIRENRENRENNRDGCKEKQRSKRNRMERTEKEMRERSPRVSHDLDKDFLARLELSKRSDNSPPNSQQQSVVVHHSRESSQREHHQQSSMSLNSDNDDGGLSSHEMQVTRHPSNTDTDSDEPKKHSIFDIIDDGPAYISMYDKVKARSTKNMQKLEEEKRQVRLRDKFSQLKQRRARREEKKQSTSWDGDSVSSKALTEDEGTSESDSTRAKSLSRKGSRSRIHSDTSEEDDSFNNKLHKIKTERFHESDNDLGFADTEEKQNPTDSSNPNVNSLHNIKKEPRSSDDEERIPLEFPSNHPSVVNNHQRDSRKKSHKKKQKRQKTSISSEEGVSIKLEPSDSSEHKSRTNILSGDLRTNHMNDSLNTPSSTGIPGTPNADCPEERMRQDKKARSKKEKRRDRNGEEKMKARRKRLNRQEARDSQRMEDIFGPESDDVEESPKSSFFNRSGNLPSENNAYSDSDGATSPILDLDRVRRKAEKKRRHQAEDENSVDLVEAGREIEAKLLGLPMSPKQTNVPSAESNDHDVFRFTDDNDSVEPSTPTTAPEKVKEKKKKRKKSKEERSRKDHHHHHHRHHHDDDNREEFDYLDYASSRASTPLARMTVSPISRDSLISPIPKNPIVVSTTSAPIISPAEVSPVSNKLEKKKEKFIPGFGTDIDETIHENAVKSISEPEETAARQSCTNREDSEVSTPVTPPPRTEDKPRVVISQEETEDAVAALLEETFGGSTEDFSYEGEEEEAEGDNASVPPSDAPQEDVEEMQQAVESLNASTAETDADLKPDTPQSEHDLQIDTDTEEDPNYETFDLTQPPKTPDIPSFYKSPAKTPTTAPTLILAPEKPVENCTSANLPITAASTRPPSPPTSVISHSWGLTDHKRDLKSQFESPEPEVGVTGQERAVPNRSSSPLPQQYKQPILGPCSVPTISEAPRIPTSSPRPSIPVTTQPLYQRLPVPPQCQMVSLRQASPRMPCVTTTSSSIASGTIPSTLPPRNPPLIPSQLSPRVPQPLSPNGQWSRSPHVSQSGKPSPPPARIPVSVPISAHRPSDSSSQHIYSTAASQQPVIQHAPGMRALAPSYPRGGLPPLTLNIPPRPYMPVPPLASSIQVKTSRDSLVGKSVIETLIPVNPDSSPQRLEEPKISPAVIPESTNKASTSPKIPSPNQPPTYIPETAKIESASTSSPNSQAKVVCIENSEQKQAISDSNLLSPKAKEFVSKQDIHGNLHLLTTHTPRASTPSPVIVAHGQPHIVHKTVVHALVPPTSNQSLVKTVVPVVSQQYSPTTTIAVDKIAPIVSQARSTPVTQGILLVKPHSPVSQPIVQSIITRVLTSTVSSVSTTLCTAAIPKSEESIEKPREEPIFLEKQQQQEKDKSSSLSPQVPQPMQLTPPVQSSLVETVKQEEKKAVDIPKSLPLLEETSKSIESTQPTIENVETKIKIEKLEPEKIETPEVQQPPKTIDMSDVIVPKVEPDLSPKSEIPEEPIKQEEETSKERDDPEIEEESIEEPIREPSTDPLALDVAKEDPTDSKEDSDYWSAKEVNIESVIKKVDALCDGETNDAEPNEADEDSQHEQEANGDPNDASKGETDCWPDSESTEGDSKKDYSNNDDHDEGVETCEIESPRSRRGRSKNRRGAATRVGVTTRRGGKTASTIGNKRGGRTSRGSKHSVEKNKLPADVYEFHDDSEEDNAGRPRLILTIKSPGPNVTGPNATPATPIAAVKEVPPEEFVSPAANTRKSRRLAEKDRSTVDDTIEDVVRGAAVNKALMAAGGVAGAHATRRSTRNNNSGPRGASQQQQQQQSPQQQQQQQGAVPLVSVGSNLPTEPRKSPRGPRKGSRRTSENCDDSSEEKSTKDASRDLQESLSIKEEIGISPISESPSGKPPEETKPVPNAIVGQKSSPHEPMTLIDPVTGMLIPMRESEEGQYIPVSTASGQLAQNAIRTTCEIRGVASVVGSVTSAKVVETNYQQRPRETEVPTSISTMGNPLNTVVEIKKENIVEPTAFCQPPKIQIVTPIVASQPSVITKPHSPIIQSTATTVVIQSTVTPTTATVMTTTPSLVAGQTTTTTIASTCIAQPAKPTSLKAHVLNAANKLVSPIVQQATQAQPIVVNKPAVVTSITSQPVVQNIMKQPNQAIQSVRLQIPAAARVVSPSLSPRAKPITIGNGPNGKQGQPMSPVLNSAPGAPPNPKQHLLQAAKQQAPTIVNLPQKLPINAHPGNVTAVPVQRIHNPVSQATTLKGINGQPHLQNPKAHLLQAVVPTIVTGAIASPPNQPHIIGAQPVVTVTSCSRPANVPKQQIAGTMEPPKVEVSMSGCIMVPTASPQARGVPVVPTYEAPLHATAGAAPTPGGQYGLVPPHRSQSPPLPPPAHHHANASQSDVVNHYGGLSRAGELPPPHYMHPQVLQYQYLRAQQEALTAPRIAYHVPGARSPHLPLDPKLEAGGEESHSPPLELRRTPQDRTTDSPQVAQVYMLHGTRLPPPIAQYSPAANPPLAGAPTGPRGGYYEPPPAHIRSQYPMAGSEAPTDRAITPERPRKHQVATPPHASQVPPQADSLLMLLQRYPVMWQGLLALKNDQAAVQMHFVFGNPNVARDSLPCNSDGSTPPLRIAQRMRLEQTQLDGVARKMQTDNEHCMLLALPCGRDHMDVLQQSKNLQTGFITYLQQKQAAGIVNIPGPVSQQPAYVVHIFPSCDFANESLARIAPDLLHRVAEIAHLLIVIATV